MKKVAVLLSLVLALGLVFAACAPAAPAEPSDAPQQSDDAAEPSAEPAVEPAKEGNESDVKALKVGLSNTFMYPWRAQMIDDMERTVEFYKGKGLVSEFTVQNAGADVNAQIAQIRNFINSGVDVLLINPMSADALNPVAEEAVEKGITVVALDQAITAKGVFNITIDHYDWGYQLADHLAQELGGKGQVGIISGLDGHPASDARVEGQKAALAQYKDIELVNTVQGGWDIPGAQKAANSLLAAYPNLAGIATQDGMVIGVMNAAKTANRNDLKMTGETQVAVLKAWKALKDNGDFSTFGIVNPPGIGATALGIAVRLAQGKTFTGEVQEGNIYYYPIKTTVDNSNFDEFFAALEGRPDSYYPDEWHTEEELDALFE